MGPVGLVGFFFFKTEESEELDVLVRPSFGCLDGQAISSSMNFLDCLICSIPNLRISSGIKNVTFHM